MILVLKDEFMSHRVKNFQKQGRNAENSAGQPHVHLSLRALKPQAPLQKLRP
jgi:hypothetical protein